MKNEYYNLGLPNSFITKTIDLDINDEYLSFNGYLFEEFYGIYNNDKMDIISNILNIRQSQIDNIPIGIFKYFIKSIHNFIYENNLKLQNIKIEYLTINKTKYIKISFKHCCKNITIYKKLFQNIYKRVKFKNIKKIIFEKINCFFSNIFLFFI